MKRIHAVSAVFSLLFAVSACAEVKQAAPDAMVVAFSQSVAASPAKTYAAIANVGNWWSSEHTWSGSAKNLSLKPEAGGCFCENWEGGSAEHGHVIMTTRDKLLRLAANLGPLQAMAVSGVLTFELKPDGNATQLTLEYRVNGASSSALDKIAPGVDQVIGEQFARLSRYVETGNADAPGTKLRPATH